MQIRSSDSVPFEHRFSSSAAKRLPATVSLTPSTAAADVVHTLRPEIPTVTWPEPAGFSTEALEAGAAALIAPTETNVDHYHGVVIDTVITELKSLPANVQGIAFAQALKLARELPVEVRTTRYFDLANAIPSLQYKVTRGQAFQLLLTEANGLNAVHPKLGEIKAQAQNLEYAILSGLNGVYPRFYHELPLPALTMAALRGAPRPVALLGRLAEHVHYLPPNARQEAFEFLRHAETYRVPLSNPKDEAQAKADWLRKIDNEEGLGNIITALKVRTSTMKSIHD